MLRVKYKNLFFILYLGAAPYWLKLLVIFVSRLKYRYKIMDIYESYKLSKSITELSTLFEFIIVLLRIILYIDDTYAIVNYDIMFITLLHMPTYLGC